MKTAKRILGFDFARGLAIIGMIFVNFKIVMTSETSGRLYATMNFLSGKAAALFVVLAGIGMTLMYNSALRKNDIAEIKRTKINLLKRSAFLFVIGLSYFFIWPADILHFYGIYLLIGVLFLAVPRKWIIILSLIIIFGFSFSTFIFDYEKGWNWETLYYSGFFTIKGFMRNLFFNGFHPVIPWVSFLLTGIWVGRLNFNDSAIRKKTLWISLTIFLLFKALSLLIVHFLSLKNPTESELIQYSFGTTPMPPMFFYMITAASLAVFIITLSVYITEKFWDTLFIKQMVCTGQLALSNYFFHVVIGMGVVWLLFGKLERSFSIEFTVAYATFYNVLTVVLSHYWRNTFQRGPLEFLMRKITG